MRLIRAVVNKAVVGMSSLLDRLSGADAKGCRPSTAAKNLLRAMLQPVFHTVLSECQVVVQTQCNLLFHWFVGLFVCKKTCGFRRATIICGNRGRFRRLLSDRRLLAWFGDPHAHAS